MTSSPASSSSFISSTSSSSWEGAGHERSKSPSSLVTKKHAHVDSKKRKLETKATYSSRHISVRFLNTTLGKTPERLEREDRICAFCRQGHAEGLEFSKGFENVLTEESVWASEDPFIHSASAKKVLSYYAHTVCVHFCPRTSYDMEKRMWCNVNKELNRSRSLSCVVCEEKGATIGCNVKYCASSCHFPCGIKDNRKFWSPNQHLSEAPFFCPNHQQERREEDSMHEMERLADLSQGREAIAIPLELSPASRINAWGDRSFCEENKAVWGRFLPTTPLPRGILRPGRRPRRDFTYLAATVDSKSAQVRLGPEREKRCCTCSGPEACRDSNKCECLRDGRNYFKKGRRLDYGHPLQVYECNLNCSCHAVESETNNCRNRLVQRGMTCPLAVSYLGSPTDHVSSFCGPWGLTAVDEIPLGSFVCTVAGQLVLASHLEHVGQKSTSSSHEPGSSTRTVSTKNLVHSVRDWITPRTRVRVALAKTPSEATEPSMDVDSGDDWGGKGLGKGAGEKGKGKGKGKGKKKKSEEEREVLVVDQRRYANISRYIRRARGKDEANLVRVAVHTANQDPRAPVLALFADRTIPKGAELLLSQ